MKKNSIRNNKGITLMAEVITVILLIIIISIISYSSMSSFKVKKLNNMYSDITAIQEKSANYYMKYGKAPVITTEKVDDEDVLASIEDEKNPNDDPNEYYKVDISALPNISLNNKPDEDGYYFMNTKTLTTYYSKGVKIDNLNNDVGTNTYHTLPSNYDKIVQLAITKEKATNPILDGIDVTYDGKKYEIKVLSEGSGGTINYRTSTDNSTWEDWSTSKPSLTDAGILYVQAYVKGDSTHSDSETIESSIKINKKEITVTAEEKNIGYGDDIPNFTYSVSGVVTGEEVSFDGNLTCSATNNSNPGYYDIIGTALELKDNGLFKADNYSLTYVKNKLTIDPVVLFDANGGTGTMTAQRVTYASNSSLTQNSFVRNGYHFSVWKDKGSETTYQDKGTINNITNNLDLIAQWTANELIFNDQTPESVDYSSDSQTITITGASNGTDSYTYTEKSEKNSSGTDTTYISISGTTITLAANTPAGTYTYVVTATDSNSKKTKDATITITVNKVAATNPTLTDTTATYDGQAHEIGVSGGVGGTINYRTSTDNSTWGDWTEAKPSLTDAGTLYVQAYVVGDSNHNNTSATASKKITINKKAIQVTSEDGVAYYDETEKTFTISVTEPTSGCTIYYKEGTTALTSSNYTSGTTTTKPTRTAAGTTTVQWYVHTTNGNYSDVSGSNTITVNKVAATNPTLTDTTATYDGEAHEIGVSGGSGGTINYRTSTDNSTWGDWSTSKPSLTDAGTLYVQAYVVGDSNHNDTDKTKPVTGKITINQATLATPIVSISTEDGKVTWNPVTGATGYQIKFDDGSWTTETSGSKSIITETTETGTKTAYVRAVSTNSNYKTPSDAGSKSVTVCSLTLNKGTGIDSVTGAGRYVSEKTVTIGATAVTGYTWSEWTVTSGNTPEDVNAAETTLTITQDTTLQAIGNAIGRIINLGNAREIDVSSILPNDYTNLTADDFLVELIIEEEEKNGEEYIQHSIKTIATGVKANFTPIKKVYDPSTGKLLINDGYLYYNYYQASNNKSYGTYKLPINTNTYVVIGKEINTGTTRTIDVSKIYPKMYKNLTNDNFIVEVTGGASRDYKKTNAYMGAKASFYEVKKEYDPNTGILEITKGIFKYLAYNANNENVIFTSNYYNLNIKINMFLGNIEQNEESSN